jgi:hypothetical protein
VQYLWKLPKAAIFKLFFTIVSLPAYACLFTLAASNEVVHAGEAA